MEHQENYMYLLREIFRVTNSRVFINFFLPLTGEATHSITFDNVFYHNKYSRRLFFNFCTKYGWELAEEKTYCKRIDEQDYFDQIVILRRLS